jgi:hypothetical protein
VIIAATRNGLYFAMHKVAQHQLEVATNEQPAIIGT